MQLQTLNEFLPVFRHHEHINTGVHPQGNGIVIVLREIIDAIPVGDNKAVEPHFIFQNFGQQVSVAVTFVTVPTVGGCHDGEHACLDRTAVWPYVDTFQVAFSQGCLALVDAM